MLRKHEIKFNVIFFSYAIVFFLNFFVQCSQCSLNEINTNNSVFKDRGDLCKIIYKSMCIRSQSRQVLTRGDNSSNSCLSSSFIFRRTAWETDLHDHDSANKVQISQARSLK